MKRENIVVIFSIIPSFFRAASFMIGRANVNIIKWQISSFDQIIRVKIDEQIINYMFLKRLYLLRPVGVESLCECFRQKVNENYEEDYLVITN